MSENIPSMYTRALGGVRDGVIQGVWERGDVAMYAPFPGKGGKSYIYRDESQYP